MKTIKIGEYNISLVDELTWGQHQDIEDVMLKSVEVDSSGIKQIKSDILRQQKYKVVEVCITKIKKGDEVIKFSKEWMDNLSKSNGDEILAKVNEITKKK